VYCDREGLIDRFGEEQLIQLTDQTGSEIIDDAVLENAILDASAEIDMYLAGRYALPLSTTPLPLARIACVLVRDLLAGDSDKADEQWKKEAEACRKTLDKIATGKISLGVDALAATPVSTNGAEMQTGGRIWGRDASTGFI